MGAFGWQFTDRLLQAAPIASPVPRSHTANASIRKDFATLQAHEDGRGTPLPEYEKTQSVPFTLALQEEKDNPGQFQLVVNVDPRYQKAVGGSPLQPSPSKKLIANLQEAPQEAPSLGYDVSQLYHTQKSSPPSTPREDQQGWSELDAIPSEFLQKVVPDWKVTFSRSDSTASTQSRKLADIKARIKKSGKGFVVRLLKGSNADSDEVAEVRLGRDSVDKLPTLSELDSTAAPAELDSDNIVTSYPNAQHTPDSAHGAVFEIGSSSEPGVERHVRRRTTPEPTSIPQWLSQTSNESGFRFSMSEDTFSDAETLLPDVRSVADRMEDHTDIEPMSTYSSVLPTRSSSVLSIVKTPTRGLSVVGPVRRVDKGNRTRAKGKMARPDLNRTGARKSFKGRSPQSSISESIVLERLRNAAAAALASNDISLTQPSSSDETSDGDQSDESNSPERSVPSKEQNSAKPKIQRQSSAPDSVPATQSRTRLRLQTNVARPKSASSSPKTRRKRSQRMNKTHSSSPVDSAPDERNPKASPIWTEVESDELREALEERFGTVADDLGPSRDAGLTTIPRIEEPEKNGEIGQFTLPPGLEIRSAPSTSGNRFATFWSLALGAILDKLVEGIQHVRNAYGIKNNNPFSVAVGHTVDDAWLLTCANEGRFTPKIVHLDVNAARIRSDKDLAMVLREHYEHLNRRWLKWTRLRGLTTIEFTQFEVHRNRFADIRATPSMPPTSSSANEKSPSQHPYTFEAVDLIPPVGSAYLLHLFKHPEDYDGELITYLRAPKRRERLEFGMGWGINLVEGFLAQKVWAVVMACFGAGSAVFAVLWTIKKNDVQGAFGVAGWIVTLAALMLGGLQAWLE
ncbi:hypothetical protein N0V90_005229 [Kalmusia sp. IMI 367209]|nr:hypothetical protein N0V90_005229 [Kalmusia sp. IMI 367209]